jgi:hypothetical protein
MFFPIASSVPVTLFMVPVLIVGFIVMGVVAMTMVITRHSRKRMELTRDHVQASLLVPIHQELQGLRREVAALKEVVHQQVLVLDDSDRKALKAALHHPPPIPAEASKQLKEKA